MSLAAYAEAAAPWVPPLEPARPMFTIERQALGVFREVLEEYRLDTLPTYAKPRIIDIGANYGVFCVAAGGAWDGLEVKAYEPHPETCAHLRKNVTGWPIEVHELAVTGDGRDVVLYEGKHNRLECSVHDMGSQDTAISYPVKSISAHDLSPCDILKIDCEGCELEILENYPHLSTVKCVLLEIHFMDDIGKVDAILQAAGLHMMEPPRFHTMRYCR